MKDDLWGCKWIWMYIQMGQKRLNRNFNIASRDWIHRMVFGCNCAGARKVNSSALNMHYTIYWFLCLWPLLYSVFTRWTVENVLCWIFRRSSKAEKIPSNTSAKGIIRWAVELFLLHKAILRFHWDEFLHNFGYIVIAVWVKILSFVLHKNFMKSCD